MGKSSPRHFHHSPIVLIARRPPQMALVLGLDVTCPATKRARNGRNIEATRRHPQDFTGILCFHKVSLELVDFIGSQ